MQTLETSVGHRPQGPKWAFDESVASCFEDMLKRSIPDYDGMRALCLDVARPFLRRGGFVVDLGCSDGLSLLPFVEEFGADLRYCGVEVSEPMRLCAVERFKGRPGLVEIKDTDLRRDYPDVLASVTLSVLTLQFTPIEHRQRIVRDAWRNTAQGGAFILVEKVLGDTADIDALFLDRYLSSKSANGYSQEDIDRKRESLEGVLVPVTARWNEDLLSRAGFSQVDCFWRRLNFAGWIAIK